MWCPKCKDEYVDGIDHCKKCDVDLVEDLKNIPKVSLVSGDEETVTSLVEFLEFNNVKTAIAKYDAENTIYILECAEYEISLAKEFMEIFYKKRAELEQITIENQDMFDENISDEETIENTSKYSGVYVKKEEKYKETASSGYSLVIIGGIGLIFLLLIITDVISLNLASPGKYITYTGLGLLFGIFFIIGIKSLMSLKKLAKEAEEENAFTEEIFDWFEKNISDEMINEGIDINASEELKYFKRFDNIKKIIFKTYGELNEAYIEKIAEDIYNKRF